MDTSTHHSQRRAALPVWGIVAIAMLVSAVVLGVFAMRVRQASELLGEINALRTAGAAIETDFGNYLQAANARLRAGPADQHGSATGPPEIAAAPDLGRLLAIVQGEHRAALGREADRAAPLFARLGTVLAEHDASSEALRKAGRALQEEQAAFAKGMRELRGHVSRAEGRARLAAARSQAAPSTGPAGTTLQALLIEALDLGLLINDLDETPTDDELNNRVSNQIGPSLARLADLAAQAEGSGPSAGPMSASVGAIVAAIRGDSSAGARGIIEEIRASRALKLRDAGIRADGGDLLDQALRIQKSVRDSVDARTRMVRAELTRSLREAMWQSFVVSGSGLLVLVVLARVLAANARRYASSLAASERRMRTIIDAEPECVMVVGPDERLLEMNPAGLGMLETESVAQVRELGLSSFVLPEHRAACAAMHAGVIRGEPARRVFEIRGSKGTRRWLDAHAVPLRNAAGEVEAVLEVARDITQQKQAETKAREAEEFLRNAIDSLDSHTVVLGADARILTVNRAWRDFARANGGAGRDVLEGADYLAACDKAAPGCPEAARVAAAVRAVLSGETEPAPIEYACHSPTEQRWFLCSIRGFARGGERFAVVSHLNVTAVKRAEAQLAATNARLVESQQQLEARVIERTAALAEATVAAQAASKAKSEFLATMSHEIRTPLNGVVGTLDLLAGSTLSEQQKRYIQIGKTSALSLSAVIDDILDFSKIEAGKLELSPVDFDLRGTVGDLMEMLAVRASEKGLEMACSVDPRLPEIVRGDPDRLRQIVINLVNNAIKFTEQGSIALRVTPTGRHANGSPLVRFSVIDTGIGIPKDRLHRLFKAFSQTDASFSRKYGGSGLGLAICKQLAELMGGGVGVESEPGVGSTFWFEVALPVGSKPEICAAPPAPVDCRSVRLLVVDDHPLQREFIAECLATLHFAVETAPSGEDALEMLIRAHSASEPFAAVLTDHEMPGMDGIEVAVAMKSRNELAQIPVILLSSALDLDPARVRAAGCAAHFTKPLRQSTLLDAVMAAVTPKTGAVVCSAGAEPHVPAAPPTAGVNGAPVRRRVLLAEDNEINQVIACELLSKSGFDCTVAANGAAAVEAVSKEPYDLVLMDCQMPEMDGFEATREIRRLEQAGKLEAQRGRRLPIIALTANALTGDRERCLEAGMDGYTTKPIDLKHLTTTIESLMSGRTPARKAA